MVCENSSSPLEGIGQPNSRSVPKRLELSQGRGSRRPVCAVNLPGIGSNHTIPPDSIPTRKIEPVPYPDAQTHIRIGPDTKSCHSKTWILRERRDTGSEMVHVFVVQVSQEHGHVGIDANA